MTPMTTQHPTPATTTAASTTACSAPTPRQWAFGTDFEDPLAGVDTTVPGRARRGRARGVLPGARRRRARHVAPALGVVQQRPRPRGRHRAGQHRARPARPGPAAAGPRRGRRPVGRAGAARGLAGPGRGRARVLPRGAATSATSGWSRSPTATSGTPSPGCCCSRRRGWRRSSGSPRTADPVLAAIAAKGVKELAYHRDYAGRWFVTLAQGTEESRRRLLAGLTAVWPLHAELLAAYDVGAEVRRRARPGLRGRRRRPPGGRRDVRPRPHRGAVPAARRDAGRRPRTPDGAVVSRPRTPIAAAVTDPEMPMLTLEDLGVLRDVREDDGRVVVTITPTYSGCPAMATMRDDLVHRLSDAGYDARVVVSLTPAWSTDWISERGRAALRAHGLSAPGPAPRRTGPVALNLLPTRRERRLPAVRVAPHVELTSEFGATACKALYRCTDCLEPVRAREGALMAAAAFHTLTVADVEELTDDAVAVTFEVPDDLARRVRVRARPVADPASHRRRRDGRSGGSTRSASPPGRRPRVGVREIPDGLFSRWLVRDVRPGDTVEVQTPGGRFCPDPALLEGGRHLCVAAGSGITPMLSVASTVLGNGGDVTLLYGNRTTGSVMFAEELGRPQEPLRARAPARPRPVPRAARRRAVLRPPRRRPAAPAAHRARPGGDVRPRVALRAARDARGRPRRARRARRPGRPGALRAVLRRRPAAGAAPRGGRGHRRDDRGDRGPRRADDHRARSRGTRRSSTAHRRRGPTCRSPARAASAAPAGRRSPRARSTCAATTRSSRPRSRPASC